MVIVALVCLAVVMLLALAAIKLLAEQRRHLRVQTWEVQAELLADAGLQRAEAALAGGGEYAGETWHVAPEELDGKHAALVRISVEAVADRPAERRVRVVADYPNDPQFRARRTLETRITVE